MDNDLHRRSTDSQTEQQKAFESFTDDEMAFFKKLVLANRLIKIVLVPALMLVVTVVQIFEHAEELVRVVR